MVSNGLPLIPALSAFPRPVRYVAVALLAGVPIAVVLVVLIGFAHSPTAALDATVEVITDGGDVDADSAPFDRRPGRSGTTVRGVIGDGSRLLAVRTGSGDVTLTRL